jgi:hypothetical protein
MHSPTSRRLKLAKSWRTGCIPSRQRDHEDLSNTVIVWLFEGDVAREMRIVLTAGPVKVDEVAFYHLVSLPGPKQLRI